MEADFHIASTDISRAIHFGDYSLVFSFVANLLAILRWSNDDIVSFLLPEPPIVQIWASKQPLYHLLKPSCFFPSFSSFWSYPSLMLQPAVKAVP
jgi:hypothetical protein